MSVLQEGLNNFCNSKDKDIEKFLREKALLFEERHWCSTFLLIDEQVLKNTKRIKVEGYFTLSNKILRLSEEIKKTKKKKLFNGLSVDTDYLHTILIGQLGKYIDESSLHSVYGNTSMEELLDLAFQIVEEVTERIPCRCVLVECRESTDDEPEEEKSKRANLHGKYVNYGFSKLQKENNMVQYVLLV